MPYRPDIDGLRAIAVLLVVAFHLEIPPYSGGFVGVDVFFVISGFLITGLILSEVEEGRFSYARFYARRVGRLFPALWTTIAATFAVASWMFSPDHLERLAGSALHALLCVANVFFLSEVGYFDESASVKPLLHFWSLSVEEQFYFVWPVALVTLLTCVRDRRLLFGTVAVVACASLATAISSVAEEVAFYMMPFRIIEFVIGASLVRLSLRSPRLADLSGALGLVLIFTAAIGFDGETEFPGMNALLPCAGTALVLLAGQGRLVARVLSLGPMVWVGRRSYSLYLCHWPIYVFTRYQLGDEEPSDASVVAILAASFAVAAGMHHFVESPLRSRARSAADAGRGATFGLACALLALVSTFPLAHAWASGGWAWRYGDASSAIAAMTDLDSLRDASIRFNRERVLSAGYTTAARKVLVVGDSHARDVSNGLVQVLDPADFEVRSQLLDDVCFRFLPDEGKGALHSRDELTEACKRQIDLYRGSTKVVNADVFVFSADLDVERAGLIRRWLSFTRAVSRRPDQRFVVMDRTVTFNDFHPQALRMLADGSTISDVNRAAHRFAESPVLASVADVLEAELSGDQGVKVVHKRATLCSAEACSVFLNDGTLAIWDRTHWTVDGARFFMAALIDRRPSLLE